MRLVDKYGVLIDQNNLPTMVYTADKNICIHKIHQCGENWYLNCRALEARDFNLQTTDLREAIINAKFELCCKLKKLDESVGGFVNSDVEDQLVESKEVSEE